MFSGSAVRIKTQVNTVSCYVLSAAAAAVSAAMCSCGSMNAGPCYSTSVWRPGEGPSNLYICAETVSLIFPPWKPALFCSSAVVCFQVVGNRHFLSAGGQWRRWCLLPSAIPFTYFDLCYPACSHPDMLPGPWFSGCWAKCYCCATKLAQEAVSFTDNRKTDLYHVANYTLLVCALVNVCH